MATGHQSKATPRQVSLRGAELLNNALLSKDTAFTEEERVAFLFDKCGVLTKECVVEELSASQGHLPGCRLGLVTRRHGTMLGQAALIVSDQAKPARVD